MPIEHIIYDLFIQKKNPIYFGQYQNLPGYFTYYLLVYLGVFQNLPMWNFWSLIWAS